MPYNKTTMRLRPSPRSSQRSAAGLGGGSAASNLAKRRRIEYISSNTSLSDQDPRSLNPDPMPSSNLARQIVTTWSQATKTKDNTVWEVEKLEDKADRFASEKEAAEEDALAAQAQANFVKAELEGKVEGLERKTSEMQSELSKQQDVITQNGISLKEKIDEEGKQKIAIEKLNNSLKEMTSENERLQERSHSALQEKDRENTEEELRKRRFGSEMAHDLEGMKTKIKAFSSSKRLI
ncbi:MAG: hypothetical protein M1827_001768 [Pycnora praestabilis]|nr:MAG: hypothetical protein M1827_001768 [Pycnora praestabilis]